MTEEEKRQANAFRSAISAGDIATVRSMHDADPDLVNRTPTMAAGPWLNTAARHPNTEMIETLLDLGADPNSMRTFPASGSDEERTTYGQNALYRAAASGLPDNVRVLHEAGAIMDTSDVDCDPLWGAVHAYVPVKSREGCLPVALYLLDAGIDHARVYETTRPIGGITALEFAWEMGARHIARAIAERRAGGDGAQVEALLAEAARISNANTEPVPEED